MEIGNVYDSDENNKLSMEIVGLDVLSGLPKTIQVSGYEVRQGN